ncbi:MAG: hypothetical protein V3W44_10055 [Dehalococcoidales bacterium]
MTVNALIATITREFGVSPAEDKGQLWIDVRGTDGKLRTLSFIRNGGGSTAVCLHVKRAEEMADSHTDYFPGSFYRTIKSAIAAVKH